MTMNSLKNILEKCMENPWKIQKNFTLEVMEINDIAEKLFVRIDQKIKDFKIAEARADEKIATLDGLITTFGKMNNSNTPGGAIGEGRQKEVQSLFGKGFKADQIARILDLPSGEVELILNLIQE
jgi:hypothetical protein